MKVVARKRWTMWLASLMAVAVLTGAAIAQIRVLSASPTPTKALSPTRPPLITPTRPPLISPIRP
jgi:hypothetical protein